MKTIVLIRHGTTAGNLEKRYVGRTNEPLCPAGEEEAAALAGKLPRCGHLFSSPLIRCGQTAATLFRGREITFIRDLRECDFGEFEGKTAAELADDPAYAAWLGTNCAAPIPGGEDVSAFKSRCTAAFASTVMSLPEGAAAAFVLHGGCIMAILERFALPRREFYAYHIGNCCYFICALEAETLTITAGPISAQ